MIHWGCGDFVGRIAQPSGSILTCNQIRLKPSCSLERLHLMVIAPLRFVLSQV
jgi:hypothetical protein